MTAKEKLSIWVNANPNGYLNKTLREIGAEAGVSASSVGRELPKIIAQRDGIMPSEVVARREALGYKRTPRQLSAEDILQIQKYAGEGFSVKDIAYIMECSEQTVRKYIAADKEKAGHENEK